VETSGFSRQSVRGNGDVEAKTKVVNLKAKGDSMKTPSIRVFKLRTGSVRTNNSSA
jgi:hypothetical protein